VKIKNEKNLNWDNFDAKDIFEVKNIPEQKLR
jgi:hypothetical protein